MSIPISSLSYYQNFWLCISWHCTEQLIWVEGTKYITSTTSSQMYFSLSLPKMERCNKCHVTIKRNHFNRHTQSCKGLICKDCCSVFKSARSRSQHSCSDNCKRMLHRFKEHINHMKAQHSRTVHKLQTSINTLKQHNDILQESKSVLLQQNKILKGK